MADSNMAVALVYRRVGTKVESSVCGMFGLYDAESKGAEAMEAIVPVLKAPGRRRRISGGANSNTDGSPGLERVLSGRGFRLSGRPGCRYADLMVIVPAGFLEAAIRLDGNEVRWVTLRSQITGDVPIERFLAAVEILRALLED